MRRQKQRNAYTYDAADAQASRHLLHQHQHSPGRRYPNADNTYEPQEDEPQYSEINTNHTHTDTLRSHTPPPPPLPPPQPLQYDHDQLDAIYSAPATPRSFVEEEMRQTIDAKRKRTLKLLMRKEAPRASIEQTSSIEDQPTSSAASITSSSNDGDAILRPSSRNTQTKSPVSNSSSVYDNIQRQPPETLPLLEAEPQDLQQQQQQQQQLDDSIINSPSESANLNTLSIVSDVLADVANEDHSVVHALERG